MCIRDRNEPVSSLNAVQLASELRTLCRNAQVKFQVLDKAQIEALGMGGLLAVNKGSVDPPTFSILEYKPKKAVNAKPIVLVGKGVVYDTGGLSLKPTPNSMDYMKCDMAGGACVAGAIAAAALLELPVHVVALVPATDNRPGGNAFAPGDVVRMQGRRPAVPLGVPGTGELDQHQHRVDRQRHRNRGVDENAGQPTDLRNGDGHGISQAGGPSRGIARSAASALRSAASLAARAVAERSGQRSP